MNPIHFKLEERLPTVAEFQKLRSSTGWEELEDGMVQTALSNSLFGICTIHENEVIGISRIIGDGALYFYVQDMMVLKEYRNQGIGQAMLNRLLNTCLSQAQKGTFIGLMSAEGAQSFYLRNGFLPRPEGRPGMYLPFEKWQVFFPESWEEYE